MKFARLAYPIFILLTGLGVGVFWSPLGSSSPLPSKPQDAVNARAESESQVEKLPSELRKQFEKESEDFVKQFKDMTIQIKKYPLDASASQDGRFVIRLFGSIETIASDLRQIGPGGVKVLDRHYGFTCGDIVYCCDFARSIEGSKMQDVVFDVEEKGKTKFVYFDSDGDGLWDRFTDLTQEPAKTYVREGAGWSWKEITRTPTPTPNAGKEKVNKTNSTH